MSDKLQWRLEADEPHGLHELFSPAWNDSNYTFLARICLILSFFLVKHFTFELAVFERTQRGSGGAGRAADRTSCERHDSQPLSGCENHWLIPFASKSLYKLAALGQRESGVSPLPHDFWFTIEESYGCTNLFVYLSVHPFTKKTYYEFLCYSKLAGAGSVLFKLADYYSHTAHQRILAGEADIWPMTVLLLMPDKIHCVYITSAWIQIKNKESVFPLAFMVSIFIECHQKVQNLLCLFKAHAHRF